MEFSADTNIDGTGCFTQLMRHVDLPAMMMTQQGEVLYCNDCLLDLAGWSLADVTGRAWTDVCAPVFADYVNRVFVKLWRGNPGARHHQHDVLTRSGERRMIRWHNLLLRDISGTPIASGSIGEETTEQVRLERALLNVSARERGQVQRELHDGLGQELFGIALIARAIADAARTGKPLPLEDLSALAGATNDAIDTCRRIARGLSPSSHLEGGLIEALKRLVATLRDNGAADVSFEGRGAYVKLPEEWLEDIYLIAQEALTNALKHARAKRIQLRLHNSARGLVLQIIDDGVGISRTDATGLGHGIMRYRAERVGGELHVRNRVGGGTMVAFRRRASEHRWPEPPEHASARG